MNEMDISLRRNPKQDRSRERVDEILGAAKKLIGEKGVDAVKMREIAALAGGPISSVYQYFPNKTSIIAHLHQRWSDEISETMTALLKDMRSFEDLSKAMSGLLDFYYHRIVDDPANMDVLNAIQADKSLHQADLAITRGQVMALAIVARPLIREDKLNEFDRVAFVMFQLAGSVVRLALSMGKPEGDGIIEDYKVMIRAQLAAFAKP